MLGDFFTKPLQGGLFTRFRDVILGYEHVDTLSRVSGILPPLEERVGNCDLVDSTTVHDTGSAANLDTKMQKLTWAEVVVKKGKPEEQVTSKFKNKVVSRSFSRNNPVNRKKV